MSINQPHDYHNEDIESSANKFEQTYRDELDDLTPRKGIGFSELPFAIIGVVAILVIIIFLVIPLRSEVRQQNKRLTALEERLLQIETRAVQTGPSNVELQSIAELKSRLERLSARMDQAETSLSARLDDIAQTVTAPPPPQPAPQPAVVPAKPAPSAPAAAGSESVKYHVVKKGDTLYSIGRGNGLTVEALLTLNGLKPNQTIKPGQKLRVSK